MCTRCFMLHALVVWHALTVVAAQVIGLEKLRTAYKQFEARRNLVKQYDIFLADDRIVPMLTKTLGKVRMSRLLRACGQSADSGGGCASCTLRVLQTFLARKKNPVPIKIRRKDFGQAVQRVLDSTYLFLGSGPCSTVRVGPADLGVDGLVDNIVQGMENVVKHLPKGWASVKSVNLKVCHGSRSGRGWAPPAHRIRLRTRACMPARRPSHPWRCPCSRSCPPWVRLLPLLRRL